MASLVLVLYLLLVIVSTADARHQVDATSDADGSRLKKLGLAIGCPEFLSAFYESNASSAAPFRSFPIIKGAGFGYVVVHFAKLWLPRGGSVLLRSVGGFTNPDVVFNLSQSLPSGEPYTDVYTPPMLAREFRIEFYRDPVPPSSDAIVHDSQCFGFVVDSMDYVLVDDNRNITPSREAICADDNSVEAVCAYDDPRTREAYLASRAVARLAITREDGRQSACTGWLLGSEGHLITNFHCIKNDRDAGATTVEFAAEGATCGSSCEVWGACPGTVEAISTTLVHANSDLDYALLKLQTNVNLPAKYGFLRFKATQARVGQEVYIPQHPMNFGKRLAIVDDFGNRVTITKTDARGCNADGYAYSGDTQGGSSGSPVVDAQDHGVVALHHCGEFCSNTGIPSISIVRDMMARGVLPANAVDPGDSQNTAHFPRFEPARTEVQVTLHPQLTLDGVVQLGPDRSTSVEQFEFVLHADAQVSIDVLSAEISDDGEYEDVNGDCRPLYMDAIVFVFASGNPKPVLVADDDSTGAGTSDGSISSRDPYAKTFLRAGTYVLAVAAVPTTADEAFKGRSRPRDPPEVYSCDNLGSVGAYRLRIDSSTPMVLSRLPPSLPITGSCLVPARAICAL
ncbi:hypothetical protein P43SY_006179 [Pythium insidiosum]|uniref:Serine protease n=1 Tax=Pythium insidiosum TaxID=114742 RepID=A0AAD5LES8_PYTIN|nr:hypothetical protein P43SY_006179 [Pythium insidiosum]